MMTRTNPSFPILLSVLSVGCRQPIQKGIDLGVFMVVFPRKTSNITINNWIIENLHIIRQSPIIKVASQSLDNELQIAFADSAERMEQDPEMDKIFLLNSTQQGQDVETFIDPQAWLECYSEDL
jgi:hypothetical protein